MASVAPPPDDQQFYDAESDGAAQNYEINFTEKMTNERDLLKHIFRELHDLLTAREQELLDVLDTVGQKIGRAIGERQQQLDKLHQTLAELSVNLKDNQMLSTLHESQKPVLRLINQLGEECDKISKIGVKALVTSLQEEIRQFGKIEYEFEEEPSWVHLDRINSISAVEASELYKNRTSPTWVAKIPTESKFIMKSGLIPTRQLAINRAGNQVALADKSQECIHIFMQDGTYFNCIKPSIGPPQGVVFHSDSLFVTSPSILAQISMDDWVVKSTYQEKNFAFSVLDSWSDNVYACLPDSVAVAIFGSGALDYKGLVSFQVENVNKDRTISDFKVVGGCYYVLFCHSQGWLSEFSLFKKEESPLQVYSGEGIHIRSIASGENLKAPAYFCFDEYNNILVTNIGIFHDEIVILSEDGSLIGSVGKFWLFGLLQPTKSVCNPTGIVCTANGVILVACTFTNYPVLQAY